MRLRRLAAARILAVVAVSLLAASCTSTTRGSGRVGRSTSVPGPVTSETAPGTSTLPAAASRFLRAARRSAIGDPARADLCAAVGVATFAQLGTATLDPVQYPPGCSFTLTVPGAPVLSVSVFAAWPEGLAAEARTKRTVAGLDVYSFPFDARTGGCERDVVADRIRLVVDALARGSAEPEQRVSCAATDTLADRLAQVVADRAVPRLSVARPTLFDVDACRAAKAAGITGLSDFTSAKVVSRGFAVNCELSTKTVFLFIDLALAASTPPPHGTPTTVGGHEVYRIAARPGFCSYVSVQGAVGASGQHEEITADSTVSASGTPPSDLCDQTGQALARYLTTLGLS